MAITKEERAIIAQQSNVKKWTKVILDYSGVTTINEAFEVSAEHWNNISASEQLALIKDYRSKHSDLKLPPNKKAAPTFDAESLLFQITETKDETEQKKLLELAKLYSTYKKAQEEKDNAQTNFDKAKERLDSAKKALKLIEESLPK